MSDWGAGFATGIAIGVAIGFATGRKQKPWSELTEKEKRLRVGLIGLGVITLAVGIVVFFTFGD